jgi:hypothetical protein
MKNESDYEPKEAQRRFEATLRGALKPLQQAEAKPNKPAKASRKPSVAKPE